MEGNPGKRKLNSKEPVPAKGMPACPDWFMPEAKKEWERLAELMNQTGVLTSVDMAAFAAYCQSYDSFDEDTKYPSNLWITVEYHTVELYGTTLTSKEAKGMNYLDVLEKFENAGFINISTIVEHDIVMGLLTDDGEVKSGPSMGRKIRLLR